MQRPVQLYDTLEGKKRPFEPIERGKAGVYCCGPTVYDMSHIGHARAAIVPDILVRYLRHSGLDVKYVRNVTDIDDKIIRRAAETGGTPEGVAQRFTDEYVADMRALGCLDPQVMPTVTGHISEILELIKTLVDKDLAYAVDGDVYYRVQRFESYGKLSKRKLEDMQAGARVDVDSRKEDPMDFALWKGAKPGEPAWESPWGPGRPGWHIECSAMSQKHLGQSFDIHTGGRDLIFPHHENEIAQSQGANGCDTYARYWVHNGFINFAGEKMSKSLGNFFTIREVMGLYEPEVIRYAMLTVHYRSGLNFEVEVDCPNCGAKMDPDAQASGTCDACGTTSTTEQLRARVRFPLLEEADERLAYVYETLQGAREFLARAKKPGEPRASETLQQMMPAFEAAMDDDLNTSAALAALSEPLNEANRLVASGKGVDKNERYGTLERFVADMEAVSRVLGCFGAKPAQFLLARRNSKAARLGVEIAKVDALVDDRQKARADKDFEASDRIRDELAALGVKVRDTPAGPVWGF